MTEVLNIAERAGGTLLKGTKQQKKDFRGTETAGKGLNIVGKAG